MRLFTFNQIFRFEILEVFLNGFSIRRKTWLILNAWCTTWCTLDDSLEMKSHTYDRNGNYIPLQQVRTERMKYYNRYLNLFVLENFYSGNGTFQLSFEPVESENLAKLKASLISMNTKALSQFVSRLLQIVEGFVSIKHCNLIPGFYTDIFLRNWLNPFLMKQGCVVEPTPCNQQSYDLWPATISTMAYSL